MSELRSVIEVAQPVSREVAQPANDPWVRWLQTPDDLVAVVDRAGETTVTFEDRAVAADGARLIGASGSVRGSNGSCTVTVDELTDGPAAVLLPRR
jgi:hypothetical protein